MIKACTNEQHTKKIVKIANGWLKRILKTRAHIRMVRTYLKPNDDKKKSTESKTTTVTKHFPTTYHFTRIELKLLI